MDAFQEILTSICVIVLILLVVLFVCHFFGPKTTAWICSNHEEKIGFSKNTFYHANGYLIPSGSEFLINPSGSFKRFDSIDRDYKPLNQTSSTSPSWSLVAPNIPPQPLRPAPAPISPKERKSPAEKSPKQHSFDFEKLKITAIPRPATKRQYSSPARYGVSPINLSDVVAKISSGPRSCTNPFLNGSFGCSIAEDDIPNLNDIINENYVKEIKQNNRNENIELSIIQEKMHKNPFFEEKQEENLIFSFPTVNLNGNVDSSTQVNPETRKLNDEFRQDSNISLTSTEASISYKQMDSLSVENFDGLDNADQKQFRNRSLSETEANGTDSMSKLLHEKSADQSKNPFEGGLYKAASETYLEQFSTGRNRSESQTWSFGRSPNRQTGSSVTSIKSLSNSQNLTVCENLDTDLKRAISCDSVNSDSSVLVSDLEYQVVPLVTGLLCVGLQYDRSSMTDEGIELVITVMEAKDLIGPPNVDQFDTFVRIYLVPDESGPLQTKVFKNSPCPSYNETFSFWLSKKYGRRSLWFHLYHCGNVYTLIGENELQIGDVRRPITTWLALSDSKQKASWGELMFSLSYLPTAERLTVVVVKARNLKLNEDEGQPSSLQNIFVKVYLLKDDKKVSKKKTSTKRLDRSPIYNESMIFSVPPYMLGSIQIRLTVVNSMESSVIESGNTINSVKPIGHVIVGYGTSGKGEKHWTQMLASLRRPVAMWHAIRQTAASTTDNLI